MARRRRSSEQAASVEVARRLVALMHAGARMHSTEPSTVVSQEGHSISVQSSVRLSARTDGLALDLINVGGQVDFAVGIPLRPADAHLLEALRRVEHFTGWDLVREELALGQLSESQEQAIALTNAIRRLLSLPEQRSNTVTLLGVIITVLTSPYREVPPLTVQGRRPAAELGQSGSGPALYSVYSDYASRMTESDLRRILVTLGDHLGVTLPGSRQPATDEGVEFDRCFAVANLIRESVRLMPRQDRRVTINGVRLDVAPAPGNRTVVEATWEDDRTGAQPSALVLLDEQPSRLQVWEALGQIGTVVGRSLRQEWSDEVAIAGEVLLWPAARAVAARLRALLSLRRVSAQRSTSMFRVGPQRCDIRVSPASRATEGYPLEMIVACSSTDTDPSERTRTRTILLTALADETELAMAVAEAEHALGVELMMRLSETIFPTTTTPPAIAARPDEGMFGVLQSHDARYVAERLRGLLGGTVDTHGRVLILRLRTSPSLAVTCQDIAPAGVLLRIGAYTQRVDTPADDDLLQALETLGRQAGRNLSWVARVGRQNGDMTAAEEVLHRLVVLLKERLGDAAVRRAPSGRVVVANLTYQLTVKGGSSVVIPAGFFYLHGRLYRTASGNAVGTIECLGRMIPKASTDDELLRAAAHVGGALLDNLVSSTVGDMTASVLLEMDRQPERWQLPAASGEPRTVVSVDLEGGEHGSAHPA